MKYMGSKLSLLVSGLDVVLLEETRTAGRFVDLFCGTGRVSWFVAEAAEIPVLASDLQEYAVVLANAIIGRTEAIAIDTLIDHWIDPARDSFLQSNNYAVAQFSSGHIKPQTVYEARKICSEIPGGPIWRSYGGHYFSPVQAATFDHLIHNLPTNDEPLSHLCRAGLIVAASKCVAAPGHTAQPFRPSTTSLRFIRESWIKEPLSLTQSVLESIAPRHAKVEGSSVVADAHDVASKLDERDVVFVDPPYSNVQYSRFYHVLETIARGSCGPVSGVGRYPPRSERPQSEYSLRSYAGVAIRNLLRSLAERGCRVILTFPRGDASNGINGQDLVDVASEWFEVDSCVIDSRFSTLGGNGYNRRARHKAQELLLTMRPH